MTCYRAALVCALWLLLPWLAMANGDYRAMLNELINMQHGPSERKTDLINTLKTAEKALDAEELGQLKMILGREQLYEGAYQAGVNDLKVAESQLFSSRHLHLVYGYLATGYQLLGDYESSLRYLKLGLELVKTVSDKDVQRNAYIRAASLFYQLGFYEEVGLYAQRALQLADDANTKDICYANLYIAAYIHESGELPRAAEAFQRTGDYCHEHGWRLITVMTIKSRGLISHESNLIEDAITLMEQALAEYRTLGFQLEIASTQSALAKAYLDIGDWEKAEAAAVEAIDSKGADNKALKDAWYVMATLKARSNDFVTAYEAQKHENHYANELLNETKAREMAYQAAKFNFVEQQREIALLNSERDSYLVRQETISREHSGSLMISTVLAGITLFLSVFLATGLSQRNKYMRLAQRDGLTGTYNRATGQEKGENALIGCMARGEPTAAVLLDLDNFKRINDEFGHATGDWTLKKVVEVIRPQLADDHILCRFGGEEFMLILPALSGAQAVEVAERCREAIAGINTHYSGHSFKLTASFGVTEWQHGDLSLDPMIKRADLALYRAKHLGRNRVVSYGFAELEGGNNQSFADTQENSSAQTRNQTPSSISTAQSPAASEGKVEEESSKVSAAHAVSPEQSQVLAESPDKVATP